MKIIAVIPARYQASRFPGKLMQVLGEKTVIATTYQNVVETGLFDEVFVATDSEIIFEEINKIYQQLKAYSEGKRGFKLFVFLLKYYRLLFYFHTKNKSFFSRLNTIRKISFG